VYSAESVIKALKSNNELSCEGIDAIKCPSLHIGCEGNPDNCERCINQRCKQPISVHRNYQKLIVLTFRFMFSKQNRSGFIHKDDSSLRRLIDHKFIDKNSLTSI